MRCAIFISMEAFDTTADARWIEICDLELLAALSGAKARRRWQKERKTASRLLFLSTAVWCMGKYLISVCRKKKKNLCLGVCDQIGKTGSDSSKGGGGQSAVAFPLDCDTARVCLSIFSQGSSVTTRPLCVRHLHPVLPHRSSSRRPAASPQSRTMSTDCLSVSKHFD